MTYFGKYVTFANGTSILIYNAKIAVITDSLSFNSKKPLELVPGKNYFILAKNYSLNNKLTVRLTLFQDLLLG